MSRRVAHHSKIVLSGNNAFAEILLPHAIHRDPRSQRILGIHQPSRKIEPASASAFDLHRRQHCQCSGFDGATLASEIATQVNEGIAGSRTFLHDHRPQELRLGLAQIRQFLAHGL